MIRKAASFDNLAPSQLGERIRRARIAKGLALKQVAAEAQMYHGQLSRIERGLFVKITPRVHNICTFLGMKPDDVDVEALCTRLRSTIRTKQAEKAMSAFLDAVDAVQDR